jgi:hypothetical protein
MFYPVTYFIHTISLLTQVYDGYVTVHETRPKQPSITMATCLLRDTVGRQYTVV